MATYYVKNGGNDGASGLSDALAWNSLSKVNGFTFAPGDIICLKRGSTFNEELDPHDSGTVGNPITYKDYGDGSKPIIDAQTTRANCIDGNSKAYIVYQNLDLRNATGWGLYIRAANTNNTVDGCSFSGHKGGSSCGAILVSGINATIQNSAFTDCYNIGIDVAAAGCLIQYNTFNDIWNDVAYPTGAGFAVWMIGATCTIRNNIFTNNFVDVQVGANHYDGYVGYNLFVDCKVNGVACNAVGTAGHPTVISHNTFLHNPDYTSGHALVIQSMSAGQRPSITMWDNLVYCDYGGTNTSVECVNVDRADYVGIDLDYNLYYVTGTGSIGGLAGTQYATVALWQAALDSTSYGGEDDHSVGGNPNLVSPRVTNTLGANSAAIGAGSSGSNIGAFGEAPVPPPPVGGSGRSWLKTAVVCYASAMTATQAQWSGEHFDLFIGPSTAYLGTLRSYTSAPFITYDEARSIWTTPAAKINHLNAWATAQGLTAEQKEAMFVHWAVDTTYYRFQGDTLQSASAGAKVVSCYGSPNVIGYVLNPGNSNARAWLVQYYKDLINAVYSGAQFVGCFVDNVVPLALNKSLTNVDRIVTGGTYTEYVGTRAVAAANWDTDMATTMAAVLAALKAINANALIEVNSAELQFAGFQNSSVCSGVFREHQLYRVVGYSDPRQAITDIRARISEDMTASINDIITCSPSLFALYNVPDSGAFGANSTTDAWRNALALCYFYLAKGTNSYLALANEVPGYGFYGSPDHQSHAYTPMMEVDVGAVVDAEPSIFAQGTDPGTPNYTYYIYKREYANAIVMVKFIKATGSARGTTTATSHALGGTYYRVGNDGVVSSTGITSISLQNWEPAILMKSVGGGSTAVAPVADFRVASTGAALTILFADFSTGTPTSWYWDFGDGTNSTEASPVHTYALGGTYDISLTVTNATGSSTKVLPLYVVQIPSAPSGEGNTVTAAQLVAALISALATGAYTPWETIQIVRDMLQADVNPWIGVAWRGRTLNAGG